MTTKQLTVLVLMLAALDKRYAIEQVPFGRKRPRVYSGGLVKAAAVDPLPRGATARVGNMWFGVVVASDVGCANDEVAFQQ